MSIPLLTNRDLFMRTLLELQVEDLDEPVDLKDVASRMPWLDRHLADADSPLPRAIWRDVEFLERHRLIEVRRDNPHVRLTPLGVYMALSLAPAGPTPAPPR